MLTNTTLFIVLSVIMVLIIIVVYYIMMIIKNNITYRNHKKILNAINCYNYDMITEGKPDNIIHCSDMMDYDKSLNNLFDWGYKSILPKNKFEKIKNYIK